MLQIDDPAGKCRAGHAQAGRRRVRIFIHNSRRGFRASAAMRLCLTAALFPMLAGVPAHAQQGADEPRAASPSGTGGATVEEIVVTANRRQENMQDVPIAISAVTASQLAKANIDNTSALATAVPGLVMTTSGLGIQSRLRGVGTSATTTGHENTIAMYVDGVYLASFNNSLLEFNNLQSVEVYKGPQGTLFGRNATGGVINVTTRDPSHDVGGAVTLSYGNYDTVRTDAYLTGGLADSVAADLALHYSYQGDGWGTNLFTGAEASKTKNFAARTKWLFTPGDRDRITVAFDYAYRDSSYLSGYHQYKDLPTNWGPGLPRPFGQPYVFTGGPWDIDLLFNPVSKTRGGGGSLTYLHDFDFATLTSITAYRRSRTFSIQTPQPFPANALTAAFRNPERQFSQELRLASADSSAVKWVVGLYYLNAHAAYRPFTITGEAAVPSPFDSIVFDARQGTRSGAIFGQTTVPLSESGNTNVTAGLRYTVERRSIVGDTTLTFPPPGGSLVTGPTDAQKTFKRLTWRLSFDHRFSDSVLGYVSYNRGFKSGVYNTVPPGGPTATPVDPEILDAYEAGLKTDLFDRRLRFNIAGFFYKYKDLQVSTFTPVAAILLNGAAAEIYGVDLDAVARVTPNFTIRGGLALLHHEFTSFPNAPFYIPQTIAQGGGNLVVPGDAAGKKLPYTSDVSGSISAELTLPTSLGQLDVSATYAYTSGWFALPDNIVKAPANNMINAQLGLTLPDERTRISLWGKNLLNEAVPSFLNPAGNPGGVTVAIYAPPRTYGVALRFQLGAR